VHLFRRTAAVTRSNGPWITAEEVGDLRTPETIPRRYEQPLRGPQASPTRRESPLLRSAITFVGDRHDWPLPLGPGCRDDHRAAREPVAGVEAVMPYPPRSQLRPLRQFAGTARSGNPAAGDVQALLERFIVEQYGAGRSLREIAEQVDRSQTAVRRVLDKHGVPRRPRGAVPLTLASVASPPAAMRTRPADG
jgi:hypothetical protein